MFTERIIHPLKPVYDENSRILILGSFPSVKSRETLFYYGHKQNRFWKLVSELLNQNVPETNKEKEEFLLRNHIALWDVVKSCEIKGSSDSSIRDVIPNDLNIILDKADIKQIYVNGKKAEELYKKFCLNMTKREAKVLPSTSPANAVYTMEKLKEEWKDILEYL